MADILTFSEDYEGPVTAGIVVVEEGVRVSGPVDANEVRVRGRLEGSVRADLLIVNTGGSYEGEANVDRFRNAGVARGLVVAGDTLAKKTARFEGYLITDAYGAEPGASIVATMVAQPKASLSVELRDGARRELLKAGVLRGQGVPLADHVTGIVSDEPEAGAHGEHAAVDPSFVDEPELAEPVAVAPGPQAAHESGVRDVALDAVEDDEALAQAAGGDAVLPAPAEPVFEPVLALVEAPAVEPEAVPEPVQEPAPAPVAEPVAAVAPARAAILVEAAPQAPEVAMGSEDDDLLLRPLGGEHFLLRPGRQKAIPAPAQMPRPAQNAARRTAYLI